jgi:flagellin
MSSIMTNTAALTALQSLNATNKSLQDTQSRISTGYRVSQASDNAAYWSIATTMRSDNQAMSTVSDSLGLGASKVDTAYTGMSNAITTINSIKQKLVAAYGQTDADKEKTQTEITALQSQLKSYADGATFSGTNMLSVSTATGTAADVKIVSAFNRDAAGKSSISTIDVKVESTKLYDTGAARRPRASSTPPASAPPAPSPRRRRTRPSALLRWPATPIPSPRFRSKARATRRLPSR